MCSIQHSDGPGCDQYFPGIREFAIYGEIIGFDVEGVISIGC